MKKLILKLLFLVVSLTVMAQTNLVDNGNMSQWTADSILPDGFALGTNSTDANKYFSKSTEVYNGLNAIQLSYRSSGSGSTRYFTTNPIYLEAGNYILTFYVKGSGWLRTVNLTKGSTALPNSRESSEDNIVGTPMGTSFAAKSYPEWTQCTVNYTIDIEESYVLSFSNNNVVAGNIMHIANISLEKDEFPENTQLLSLSLNESPLNDFSPEKMVYYYKLPYETADTNFPSISYTNQEGTTVNVSNGSNLSGDEAARTTSVTVSRGGNSLIYKIIFYKGGSPSDGRMAEIKYNDTDIENYSMDINTYHQYLPYSTTQLPVVSGTILGTGTFSITQASSLSGTATERTATITCTSGDASQTQVYKIIFEMLPKLDLYLCIGQSNMVGRGYMNPSLGDLNPVENAFLLTPEYNWETASNPFNKYSSVSLTNKSKEQISPSYGFALTMKQHIDKPIGLIVNAKGGTSIQKWTKGNSERLYEESMIRALAAQKWGEFKAILWHQGESNSSKASEYPPQLIKLVNNLRQDLNIPDLYFVAGELAYWRGNNIGSVAFNEMIRTISSFVDNSDYISAAGLSPLIDGSDPHFDRESNIELGKRYAEKVLKKIYGITSDIQNSTRSLSKIYVNKDQLIIENDQTDSQLQVFDIAGRMFFNKAFDYNLNITLPAKGVYVVLLKNGSEAVSEKIIVQ